MISCVLVEDNPDDMETVRNALTELLEQRFLLYSIDTAVKADGLVPKPYTLYLIDIDLPGISGMEFALRIQNSQPTSAIVFCSNHDNFEHESYSLNTLYFVRKKELMNDLGKALSKYLRNYTPLPDPVNIEVKIGGRNLKIPWDTIVYIQAINTKIQIISTIAHEPIKQSRRFKDIAYTAKGHGFLKVGRSHLVNTAWIDRLTKDAILMKNGEQIPLGRCTYSSFRKDYLSFSAKEKR